MKVSKAEEEKVVNGTSEKEKEDSPTVDIMAQQLKFVACLKILMEELSTLATGFEVDGIFKYIYIFLILTSCLSPIKIDKRSFPSLYVWYYNTISFIVLPML